MPRKPDRVHISFSLPVDDYEALVDVALDADMTLAELMRALSRFASKTRLKPIGIAFRERVDDDERAS